MSDKINNNIEKNDENDIPTTGHSWDGIEEYDNPMPKWWLYTFYVCVFWAVLYSLAMPAWPIYGSEGATRGFLSWSTRGDLEKDLIKVEESRVEMNTLLEETDIFEIPDNPELFTYAKQAGDSVFKTWCAQCHGSGAGGVQAQGYPNLLDDDWLWGGTVDEIQYTIAHGVRNSDDEDARFGEMPSFKGMLEPNDIDAVAHYVLSLSDSLHDENQAIFGEEIYLENCAACHGDGGEGDIYSGAPNLSDAIWLYGSGYDNVVKQINYARNGVMPNWNNRLSETEIKAVATYVHSLGGGQQSEE